MPDIVFKKVEKHELPEIVNVYLTSRINMQSRLGENPANISDEEIALSLKNYTHILDTGIFYGVSIGGQIKGLSCAVVRDDVWFLSGFWVLPDFQNKGLGRPLLERVYKEGVKLNAKKFCVWSSLDPTAQTCYMKMGMVHGHPIYRLAGPIKSTPTIPDYELETLDINTATTIDAIIRGTTRKQDHEYWLKNGHKGFQVMLKNSPVGYFYCKNGIVGAGGWTMEEAGIPTTLLALKQASTESDKVTIIPGGSNNTSIKVALSLGMRVSGSALFLTSEPFGSLNQYLTSGPVLY